MNEMRDTARQLAAQGRFGDDILVHMSRAELQGIASLAPNGQMSINPATGLPEAFFFLPFLASLFGAAAPAAAAAAPAAAAAAPAAAAAGAAAAPSFLSSLGTGISSLLGMGAPAVDPLITGSTAAAAPAAAAGGALPTAALAPAALQNLPATTSAIPTLKSTFVLAQPAGQSWAGTGVATQGPAAVKAAGQVAKAALPGPVPESYFTAAKTADAATAKGGLSGLFSMKNMLPMAMGAQMLQGLFSKSGKSEKKRDIDKERYRGGDPVFPGSSYRGGIDNEWNYFPQQRNYANGGIVTLAGGGMVDPQMQMPHDLTFPMNGVPADAPIAEIPQSALPSSQVGESYGGPAGDGGPAIGGVGDQELIAQTVAAIEGKVPNPDQILIAFMQTFGEQALQDLVARVKGLKGMSDGQSDSIPAMIDGKQPAALSEGEYVVPADVVSGLGNGSTDAGAGQLDQMVQGTRMARTGSPRQPPAMNAGGLISLMR